MRIELIVDGNGLVCKLWWANAENIEERFLRAIEQVKPEPSRSHPETLVRVCWDSPSSWRKEAFPGYKQNRPPKPDRLVEALDSCSRISGLSHLRIDGMEADDCIAQECRLAVGLGWLVFILSDDKDMAQLVGDRVRWIAGGKVHNREDVIDRFGVPPEKIRHLLSWMGDTVDGLPGVKGYGPKKAAAKARAGEVGNAETFALTELR